MAAEILVAYASSQESTRGIAAAIADDLRADEISVTLEPLQLVTGVRRFSAVVLGTAIHDGSWLPGIAAFIATHRRDLEVTPLWIFASGPAEAPFHGEMGEPPEAVSGEIERVGPRDIALFAGTLQPHHVAACLRALSRVTRTTVGDHADYAALRRWTDRIRREVAPSGDRAPVSVLGMPR